MAGFVLSLAAVPHGEQEGGHLGILCSFHYHRLSCRSQSPMYKAFECLVDPEFAGNSSKLDDDDDATKMKNGHEMRALLRLREGHRQAMRRAHRAAHCAYRSRLGCVCTHSPKHSQCYAVCMVGWKQSHIRHGGCFSTCMTAQVAWAKRSTSSMFRAGEACQVWRQRVLLVP